MVTQNYDLKKENLHPPLQNQTNLVYALDQQEHKRLRFTHYNMLLARRKHLNFRDEKAF
jgi:hypothetical protein